jgi:hypothetical protein
MKLGEITHVTHVSGKPLAKPYYKLCAELREPEAFHRKFFPNQKAIPILKSFDTRKEAEQYAKQNLKQ